VTPMAKPVENLAASPPAGVRNSSRRLRPNPQIEMIQLLTEAGFSAVFDTSGEALLTVDAQGEIRRANRKARELLRIEDLSRSKPKLAEYFAGDFPNELPSAFAEAIASRSGRPPAGQEFDSTLRSGMPVRMSFRALLPGEQELLVCLEEAPPAPLPEKKWGQIQSKLLQTEKMAALGQLVSGIAHELNNPLTAIMGYAQLLLGHGLLSQQLSEARNVFQEAERARRIVKNLLYFARENKPERTRANLNEIAERTLALRSYELKVENITVECALDPGLPDTLADPYQLQQVFLNLLVNAEQALLQGRGQGHVWIRTRRLAENRIALEVSDDGPGIPPEIASRIFDPFFTTKPSGVGTGLGLSIVYGIVQQHGGEVTFENQPGAGAKFVVELPVVAVPATQTAAALAPSAEVAGAVPRGRVLVVEDEQTVAQLIVDVLREEGHQVEAVLDSQEGLTRISRNRYDLVICDLRMPRLDGPAFFEALVASGSPMKDCIIFITGDTLAPRTVEFLEPNHLPYLAKPFLVEELKLAVNRMLDGQHGREAAFDSPPAQRNQPAMPAN